MGDEGKVVFKSGASRSESALMYHLVPSHGFRRLARRFTDGAVKHGKNNWRAGLTEPEFIEQAIDHLQEHFQRFLEGNAGDDDLAAMAWGCFALMEVQRVAGDRLSEILANRNFVPAPYHYKGVPHE